MASATRLVVGGTLAAIAVAICARWPEPAPPSPSAMPRTVGEESAPTAAETPVTVARTTARTRTEQLAPPTETWLVHPFEFELSILVVDANGLPCAQTLAAAAVGTPAKHACATDVDGRATLRWRSRMPCAEVVVADPRGLLHRVPVQHGTSASIAFVGIWPSVGSEHVEVDARRSLRWRSSLLHPFAAFTADLAAGSFQETADEPSRWHLLVDHFDDDACPSWFSPEASSVRGTVSGEDGSPAANERVVLLAADGRPTHRTYTNERGEFVFAGVGEGQRVVRAGGGARGVATAIAADDDVHVVLDRGRCLRGRLVGRGAETVSGLRVEWRAADGTWCDEVTCADDGAFVFANVAAEVGDLFAFAPAGGLPIAWAKRVATGRDDVLLRVDGGDLGGLVVRGPSTGRDAAALIEVHAWQVDTGFGLALGRDASGRWASGHLAAGWYAVEAIVRGAGVLDLGRHWLDGSRIVAIGPCEMPAPARVRFLIPPEAAPTAELHQLRAAFDLRVAIDRVPTDRDVLLPAGSYALAVRDRDGGPRFVRFTARAGEETVVTVPQ